jgi:hypothetical protein
MMSARIPFAAGAALTAAGLLALVPGTAGAASALPNPCTLLTGAHPETAFGNGKTLTAGKTKEQKYGTGQYQILNCSQTVGTQTVVLGVQHSIGGSGGVVVTSQTHPSGLGSDPTLTVGTGAGNGGPVDYIVFHRGGVYVSINANGARPTTLTAFARTVYKHLA